MIIDPKVRAGLRPKMKRRRPAHHRAPPQKVFDHRLVRCQRGSDLRLLRCGAVTAHDGRAVDAGLA
jgi:hypothetical protein